MITLHAKVLPDSDTGLAITAIKRRLESRFGIDHATVEIEHGDCPDRS